ncbi:MAG: hypothetical protein HUJ27_14340 [Rhodobacteraceae bacterium]|nr:hypothetical protein [Paracoccaceae bacterium]
MITFYHLVGEGGLPRRATKCASGTLPVNGFRYCEPVRTASAFGWYVYLPMELWLLWDGGEVQWSIDQGETWYVLGSAIQYPGFASAFDAAGPESIQGYAPPFLTRTNDDGILQIWTGQIARTEEGVGAYVRAPVNVSGPGGYDVLEGVIQTEWWFGPLFANIRLRRQGRPIILRNDQPFLQLQPFSTEFAKRFEASKTEVVQGLDHLSEKDWTDYSGTVVRRMKTRERLGDYAVEVRKREKALT